MARARGSRRVRGDDAGAEAGVRALHRHTVRAPECTCHATGGASSRAPLQSTHVTGDDPRASLTTESLACRVLATCHLASLGGRVRGGGLDEPEASPVGDDDQVYSIVYAGAHVQTSAQF